MKYVSGTISSIETVNSVGFSSDDLSFIIFLLELMLITICLATIIYLATKNPYISYLSAGPIYFFVSHFFYQGSHPILVIVAMTVQALVILVIQKKNLLSRLSLQDKSQKAR